ncbi:MAG: YbaN family protein [bacterium]
MDINVKSYILRTLLIIAGTISVCIGVVGIFIPLLPTTPFLVLSAICYLRSSERFYRWLINNKFLGNYVRNWLEGRGITVRMKVSMICLLVLTIGFSIILVVESLVVRIILVLIMIGVSIHIMRLPTLRGGKGRTFFDQGRSITRRTKGGEGYRNALNRIKDMLKK